MKRTPFILITAIAVTLSLHCGKNIREQSAGRANSKNKIVIAAFYSDTKEAIAEGLVNRFKDRASIQVIPLNKLGSIDHKQYTVIVIIDSLRAWKLFNTRTRFFIRGIKPPEERKKVVLFLSAGNPKKNYRILGVDSITAATEKKPDTADIDRLSEKISALLQ